MADEIISNCPEYGMGWYPDYPDYRDYQMDFDEIPSRLKELGQKKSIKGMMTNLGIAKTPEKGIKVKIDLRDRFSPIEDQGNLGSCTANAGVALMEYYERRAFGRHIDASRLFLYKVTRNLLGWTGDRGAFLRSTMAAMRLFGVPPARYWPYVIPDFDKEPSSFCYAFAQNYQALQYYRLDSPGVGNKALLLRIKLSILAGLPPMFGFTVFSSYSQARSTGKIPFPCPNEQIVGGHAVVAVGYNNALEITNTTCGEKTTGALILRNSWGPAWGDKGYGYLPYDYVLRGAAKDWWCLLKQEWVDTGKFGL
jgi:C1A family cysteine protease